MHNGVYMCKCDIVEKSAFSSSFNYGDFACRNVNSYNH